METISKLNISAVLEYRVKTIDILVELQRGAFTKEDGDVVINEKGQRV